MYSFLIILCVLMALQPPQSQAQSCLTLSVNLTVTLQQAVSASVSTSPCMRIEIPSGEHVLTEQTLFPTEVEEIEFVGLGESVCVVCDYESRGLNYTWYFDSLHSVRMTGIHFESCPRPFRLDTIAEVEILDCSFSYFTEAVLDVFNCHHTVFNHSLLDSNTGSGIVNASYRGNTGGVSFGFNTLPLNFSSPMVLVANSVFRNNSATASSAFLTSSQAFFAQVFTGRGGSMAVFSNESRHDLQVTITNCTYESNFARSFGGGVYQLLGGFNTNHKIVMRGVRVMSNTAQLGGGGVQASFFNNGPEEDPLLMAFEDCVFEGNTGIAGGGVFVFTSTDGGIGNLVQIRNTLFSDNHGYLGGPNDYGAAVALSLLNPLVDRSNFPRQEVTNCTFLANRGANGIISVGYSPMNFTGLNIFLHNNGTALRVVGALVYLSGELQFINNSASAGDESALNMLSFGQVVLSRGLVIRFQGNSGRFGASISVESTTTSTVFTQLPGNPQCPFLHEDFDAVPLNWDDVTVGFADNTAILGSAIYVSRLNTCSWYSQKPPFFNNTYLVDWPIWEIESSNKDTGYTAAEQMNLTLSVQTQATQLVVSNTTVRAWPGLRLTLGVTGWDEFRHTTTATAGFSFKPFNETQGVPDIQFIPEIVVVGPDPTTGLLTRNFTVYYGVGEGGDGRSHSVIEGPVGIVSVQDPIETLNVESATFTLEALVCPAGYVLQPHQTLTGISVCTCNEEIADILLCEDDQETVIIRRGKWAVYVPTVPNNNLQFYACPMGYCRCRHDNSVSNTTCVYSYSHADPDLQCSCNRRGILCGECRQEDEGVSTLLNECVSCANASGLLILALIVVDAMVFIVLVFLDKPLPSWLYPFIFYIQLASVVGLDFPVSFNKIGKYLHFLGSASGFYFIYDFCLYGNMSSEMAYFIRYLPLFVGIITCAPVVIGRSFVYRKFVKRKPLKHHGLWLVFLLSYSHVVHTSMSILNCPSITATDGGLSPRWYVNGEVECFTGSHIALGLLAIIVLLAALLIIPFIILVAIGRLKNYGLELFRPPLIEVYRDGYEWWAGMELGRRFLLLLFTVSLPQNEVVTLLVVAVFTTVYSYVQPYKCRLANLLETAVNLNFLFLLIINATSFFHDDFFIFPSLDISSDDVSTDHCTSLSDIATVSWILMPFYYLPVLGACITAAVLAILFLRKWQLKRLGAKDKDLTEDSSKVYVHMTGLGPHQSWTVQLPDSISESTEGYLDVFQRSKITLRHVKASVRKQFQRNSKETSSTVVSNTELS